MIALCRKKNIDTRSEGTLVDIDYKSELYKVKYHIFRTL